MQVPKTQTPHLTATTQKEEYANVFGHRNFPLGTQIAWKPQLERITFLSNEKLSDNQTEETQQKPNTKEEHI